MSEIKKIRTSLVIHTLAAFVVGWVSSILDILTAAVIGVVVLLGCGYLSEKLTRKKGIKWWFANGIFVYLMFWLISWILFFNL